MFQLYKTAIIRLHISEVQNCVLLNYKARCWYFMYFWNTKPNDDCLMHLKHVAFLDYHSKVLCIDWLFHWYVCIDTTGLTHSKTVIIILIIACLAHENEQSLWKVIVWYGSNSVMQKRVYEFVNGFREGRSLLLMLHLQLS